MWELFLIIYFPINGGVGIDHIAGFTQYEYCMEAEKNITYAAKDSKILIPNYFCSRVNVK